MISRKEVQHIADLARLRLTRAEIKKYQKELSAILDYVKQLQKLKIRKVVPCAGGTALENVYRQDIAKDLEKEKRNKLLKQAPSKEGNFVRVKAVF